MGYKLIGTFTRDKLRAAIKEHATGKGYKLNHYGRADKQGYPIYDLAVWEDEPLRLKR